MSRTMWDGINSDAQQIAKVYKPGDLVAFYIDGLYAWTAAEIALFPVSSHVTITVFGYAADVCDCETGDLTPAEAAKWVRQRRAAGYYRPTIYRSRSLMGDVRASTQELVMGRDWDAWVADYDNDRGTDYDGEAAKQYRNAADFDESVVFDDSWPHRSSTPINPIPPGAPKWPAGQLLVEGNRGNAVQALQGALSGSGLYGVRGISVDGVFGGQTLAAVKNFQSNEQLIIDGKAGSQTRSALISIGRLNSSGQAL